MMKLTDRQSAMVSALKGCYSNITKACEKVGVSRETHYKWLSKNDDYKKECEDVKTGLVDRAEEILHSKFEDDTTALIFFLKCKGGYSEKREEETTKPIKQELVFQILPKND